MIKINLIQKGSGQSKAMMNVAFEIGIFAIILLAAAIGMFAYTGIMNGKISDINSRIQREKEEQQRLKAVIEKVNELKKKAEVFEKKVEIITELKEKQTGPAKLMISIAAARPDNLQLNSVKEQGGTIKLVGRASSSFAAATFVRDLKQQKDGKGESIFSEVDILKQTIITMKDVNYDVYEFEIVCRLK